MRTNRGEPQLLGLAKCPTGIQGLDEITGGGLPRSRPTLLCGGAGCGKTLLAMEFLVRGAIRHGEPGVFMAFEETAEELTQNVASLGYDLKKLAAQKKLLLDYVRVERSEIEETGEYDLEGLFIRLGSAIDSIGAKRVVLDTVESLFGGFSNAAILRAELRRLFRWLKDKGVTAVITGERGDVALTRQGLEEFVSDCVIVLDHRVTDQVSTRRLRVVKYRGSAHGTNEYPFLIDEGGVAVLPVTSLGLNHAASSQRISSGIERLDTMLGGKGFFRGSSILISGTAGTGKSTISAHFLNATCRKGERALLFAFEESPAQIVRNMHSIGIDLQQWLDKGLLKIHSTRPTLFGLESHLAVMHSMVETFKPSVVVLDPITNFMTTSSEGQAKAMLMRLVDFLKVRGVTSMFTSLTRGGDSIEQSEVAISSLTDTWLLLRDIELCGERNRGLYVLKSRGMAHSNQIREFVLNSHGVQLLDVYTGPEGVLTGSARVAQEAMEKSEILVREQSLEQKRRDLERKRQAMEARVAAIRAEFAAESSETQLLDAQELQKEKVLTLDRERMARSRKADAEKLHSPSKKSTFARNHLPPVKGGVQP